VCAGFLVLGLGGGWAQLAGAQTPVTGGAVPCTDGQADQYPCENVDLLSYLPIDQLGGDSNVRLNDVWGWTDPETGREYALVGRTDGVAFVDVSTPTEPVYLGGLPTHSAPSTWRDVKVYQNHAYVVSEAEDHGLQVFDLTKLRMVEDPPVTFSETAHYDRFQRAHNIVINEESGYAYVVGITSSQTVPPSAECGAGLHMIDLSRPDDPQFAGCHNDRTTGGLIAGGYTHDAQCVNYRGPDDEYQGKEICFSANEKQVNIADVTNKQNPQTITNASYPKYAYVHQAWLTEDQRYLLVDDELDEARDNGVDTTRTIVFDVSDLDNPTLATIFSGETRAADHNQYIVGNYSYQANYEAGLRILDVADPENPSEEAYFDTYPNSTSSSFNGAWSTYPFFEKQIVLVSSIGEGLFVLQPRLSPILSLNASVEGTTVIVRWTISSLVETSQVILERRRPEEVGWTMVKSFGGTSIGTSRSYEHRVIGLQTGTHQFRVRHRSGEAPLELSEPVLARVLPDAPIRFSGLPNPIRGGQSFSLVVQESQDVQVALYDVLGRRTATLYEGEVEAGARVELTLRPQSNGIHFLRVQGDAAQQVRKVVVLR